MVEELGFWWGYEYARALRRKNKEWQNYRNGLARNAGNDVKWKMTSVNELSAYFSSCLQLQA